MKGLARQGKKSLYDTDFFRWCEETAGAIREGRFDQIDREQLAEEVQDMGKRDRRELRSRTGVLLQHLLKWQWQPELRENATWLSTIREQRRQIELLLEDSPSLKVVLASEIDQIYRRAAKDALDEMQVCTGAPVRPIKLPRTCPFSIRDILSADFLPSGPAINS